MYVWALDSINVARDADGEVVAPLATLARRSMKLALMLGEPLELGEPHLIDNTFLLTELAQSAPFAKILRDHGGLRFFLAQNGKPATPKQILLQRTQNERWASSAWRVDPHRTGRFRAWLAAPSAHADTRIFEAQGRSESAHAIDQSLLEGLSVLEEIVQRKQLDNSPRIRLPNFDGPNPSLCDRIELGIATMRTRVEIGDELDEWVTDHERDECCSALERLESLWPELKHAPGGNSRTVWLDRLMDIANARGDRWRWADEIARTIVNTAYNKVVAGSFGSERLFATESPVYAVTKDRRTRDRVGKRTIDALHAMWNDLPGHPPGSTATVPPGPAPHRSPFLAVNDLAVLDKITWDNLERAIESGAYSRAASRLRLAPEEERADRQLELAQSLAGRVSLNWLVVRDPLPGLRFLREFETTCLEFSIDVSTPIVETLSGDDSGLIGSSAEVIKAAAPGVMSFVHNRLSRVVNRIGSVGLQGRIERVIHQAMP